MIYCMTVATGVRCVCVEMVRNVCVVCGYGEVYGV